MEKEAYAQVEAKEEEDEGKVCFFEKVQEILQALEAKIR